MRLAEEIDEATFARKHTEVRDQLPRSSCNSEKSRPDKTAIELFLAGVRVWEVGLRRRMGGGKSKPD